MSENDVGASWDDLRVLLALHRHRSLLAAGKALRVSTSTMARRIERLEASLGRPMVVRSTTGTHLEPGALKLVSIAEEMELGLLALRRDERELGGSVRVSMGEGFASAVTGVIAEVRRRHPELDAEVVVESRLADLAKREADLGIRKTRSRSAVLVEKALGHVTFGLYASREYAERRVHSGRVGDDDFARLEFVGYEGPMRALPQQQWLEQSGARRFPFRTNSDAVMMEATLQSQGLAVLPDLVAGPRTELVRLESKPAPPSVMTWLVCHRELRQVPRVRAVAEAIVKTARARLTR